MSSRIRCVFLQFTVAEALYPDAKVHRRQDTGEIIALCNAPIGAMWFADWMLAGIKNEPNHQVMRGPDGHCLVVRLPTNHDWIVDGRCSNCTLPDDDRHKCWVRHGIPPDVTVDKNGRTCSAGAGSISIPGWHGFLRNGYLVEC
jgi:hypothetical protein